MKKKKERKNFLEWNNPGYAIITGAAAGIGAEYAKELYKQGFSLFLIDKRKEKLTKFGEEIGSNKSQIIKTYICDLSLFHEVEQLVYHLSKISNIDILINNAGFSTLGYFENNQIKTSLDMISVHNITPVYLTRTILPKMVTQQRGIIINISSMGAFTPAPQTVIYGATKQFLIGFSKALSFELKDTNIQIQVLCPGITKTDIYSYGDWDNFDFSKVPPKEDWMSAENVVKESLEKLKKGKLIVIPGRINRFIVCLYKIPFFKKKLENMMINTMKISRN
ncbi:MAG: SDR family NAD(P)-dependent oxidoreductase [Candidatus Lokiarchaeota archaeon]|nr:SDR family NAD(P)-dependent oxidoreductase [Candidatus Lokiarchaeota archaeon]